MIHRNMYLKGLLAVAALIVSVTSVFAVTEADVVRLKDKVANGQALTEDEQHMAIKAEGLFGSQILQPQETPSAMTRDPRNPLDEYQFATVDYEWIDITGVGTDAGIANDDHNVGPFDLGFAFPLFDQTFTSVRMCSNGWASFTSTVATYTNAAIPATAEPNNALYPFWDDLYPPSGGTFYYYSDTANDRFIMSWIDVPHIGSTTETYTFQIVLYENGNVQYNYQTIAVGGTYGNTTCTVGLENAGGTEALQVCFNGAGTLPVSESSILISQPDGVPTAPTGLTLANTAGGVVLNWVNPTMDTNGNPVTPDHVEVWRGNTSPTELLATLGGAATTYTDIAPTDALRSYYVRSCSPQFCGASALAVVPVAVAPANVSGTPGANNVVISWDDPTLDNQGGTAIVTSVEVWVGPAGTGTLAGTVNGGVETFNVTGLMSGNYTFNVRALSHVFTGAATSVTVVVGNPSYFSDFETDNGDLISDIGWEWGAPTNGPGAAHSGTNCWGTLLTANYENSACYNLDIDQQLTVGSDAATLEFWMWRDCESFFDGMNVKVSTDGGATWEVVTDVTPAYDEDAFYTGNACVPSEVGWTGHGQNTWQYYVVNLGAYVGTTPVIRLSFGSDASVQYPGFYVDDLTLWGFGEPEFAPVSGTVTLDGGAGAMTAVNLQMNGIGSPTTNPAADGTYTFPNVLVGNRRVVATLAGYHDAMNDFTLTDAGATGIDMTLVRLDPPVPQNLEGSVESATGNVELTWTASTDPLVDVYPVYRRLQGEDDWVLQGSPTASPFTQTLSTAGIYEYAISARDNDVSTPVESDLTGQITLLYGSLPPTGLSANGNFDDRIVLSWFAPGTPPEFEISYDSVDVDLTCVEDGLGFNGEFPFGWFVAHYEANGPATITRVKTRHWPSSAPGCQVQMGVFEDDGTGLPTFTPLGVTDWTITDPLAWQDVELTDPVNVGSSFFIGIRQVTAQRVDIGMDFCAAEQTSTFFATTANTGPWDDIADFGFTQVLCIRAFAIGDFTAGEMELSPTPTRITRTDVSTNGSESILPVSANFFNTTVDEKATASAKGVQAKSEQSKESKRHANTQFVRRAPNPENSRPSMHRTVTNNDESRRDGRSLDDVTNYRVYRGNTQIAQVAFNVLTYTDLNRVENTPYQYHVTAIYDDGSESAATPTITAMCNMEPAAPTGLVANPLGSNQMALAWVAPSTNADGTNLVDLAGFRIYRDGTQVGTTAAGVTTYADTPPENDFFYTWTVSAIDEVPNVSEQSEGVIAAVQSPWEVVDNDWVDISAVGTPAGISSDDQIAGPFDLGFSFEYYGQTYTQISMCSNGWAAFIPGTFGEYFNVELPDEFEPHAALYPFWDDLYPPAGGEYYVYQDVANNRFIMSWINAPHIGVNTEVYTFQIILEASGGIYFNYDSMTEEGTYGNQSCTVGVEDETSTNAIQICYNGTGAFLPTTNSAIAFWAGPSGSVSGLIREDQTNFPIEGAEVTADEAPGEIAFTDVQGNYELGLEPGTYTVRVHKQGYCDHVWEDVVVEDGVSTTRSWNMEQPNATFSSSSLNMYTLIGEESAISFEITNPGGQCEVVYSITTNQTWLTANPASSVVMPNETAVITITGATETFEPGDYTAEVTVTHNDNGSPYVIPVTITMATAVDDVNQIPTEFALNASYPNPFNATTALSFDVPNESLVQIVLYNVTGQEVARPVNQVMAAGSHRVLFTADNLPTGMYLVRMSAGSFNAVQKIVLLK